MAFWRAIIPADVGGIPEVSVDVKTLELWMMQEKRKKITGIHEYLPGSVQCGLAWFNAAGSGGRFSREKPRALGRLAMSRLSSVSSGLCDFADVSKKKVNSIIRERAHVHVRLHLQNTRQSCVSRFTLETRNGNCRRWRIRPSCNSKRPASCCTLFKPKTPKSAQSTQKSWTTPALCCRVVADEQLTKRTKRHLAITKRPTEPFPQSLTQRLVN